LPTVQAATERREEEAGEEVPQSDRLALEAQD
jgi:hypothetical protein